MMVWQQSVPTTAVVRMGGRIVIAVFAVLSAGGAAAPSHTSTVYSPASAYVLERTEAAMNRNWISYSIKYSRRLYIAGI